MLYHFQELNYPKRGDAVVWKAKEEGCCSAMEGGILLAIQYTTGAAKA